MSDNYQAVLDAVRRQIPYADIGEVARQAFDISWQVQGVAEEFRDAARRQSLPHVLMRPRVFIDGDKWCALYGENLQDGVCGFGCSPAEAMEAFDVAWHASLAVEPA